MPEHDWLFDIVLDVCEKAEQLGLREMSAKLEEALDAYLEETDSGSARSIDPEVVSFGPISLGQESFGFAGIRQLQPLVLENPETRGENQSDELQKVRFYRSKRGAGHSDDSAARDDVQLDKAG